MKLDLIPFQSDSHGTHSVLLHGNQKICLMGELPWVGNRRNISCIPAGIYPVKYFARSASGKYRDCYHIINVPNRTGILIHAGNVSGDRRKNLRTHSHGCPLPGLKLGRLYGQRAVLFSRHALQSIHRVTQRKDFTLEIHRD